MGAGSHRHTSTTWPQGKIPDTHFTWGWVDPRVWVDGCRKPRPQLGWISGPPARSKSLYRLHYPVALTYVKDRRKKGNREYIYTYTHTHTIYFQVPHFSQKQEVPYAVKFCNLCLLVAISNSHFRSIKHFFWVFILYKLLVEAITVTRGISVIKLRKY